MDKEALITFVKTTQPKKWERYEGIYGLTAKDAFIKRLSKEVKLNGLLAVLRKGFKDRGIEFKVCFFKPETAINPVTVKLYDQNILHCTRQFGIVNISSVKNNKDFKNNHPSKMNIH